MHEWPLEMDQPPSVSGQSRSDCGEQAPRAAHPLGAAAHAVDLAGVATTAAAVVMVPTDGNPAVVPLTHEPRPTGEPPTCRYCGDVGGSFERCCRRCSRRVQQDRGTPWRYRRFTYRNAIDYARGLPPDGIRA